MSAYTPDELSQLRNLRKSIADFKALIAAMPADLRRPEYNAQFNELRAEARALLKGPFTEDVPRAITGDVSRDRALMMVVIGGVFLALVGFGINSIILEDVLVNSLGCCVSSGGMLLVMGALGVLVVKNARERVNAVGDLAYRADLLLYQIDHRLYMVGVGQPEAQTGPMPNLAPPESDEF